MLTRLTAPAVEPVTLSEAKAHASVIGDADDDLISRLISAAVDALDGPDGKLGRCLISQKWKYSIPGFPNGNIRLPMPPVIAVSEISYLHADGSEDVLEISSYSASDLGSTGHAVVAPKTRWPATHGASIDLVCGFGTDPQDVPEDLRNAILEIVAASYAWRESVVMAQSALRDHPEFQDTIERWRVRGFG